MLVVVSVFWHHDFLALVALQIEVDATLFLDVIHLGSTLHLIRIQSRFPTIQQTKNKKTHFMDENGKNLRGNNI